MENPVKFGERENVTHPDRLDRVDVYGAGDQVRRLLKTAQRGLPWAYDWKSGEFAQTLRRVNGPRGVTPWREGTNLRYAAMAALGIDRLAVDEQRVILAGRTAAELTRTFEHRALQNDDLGATALAAWASVEVTGVYSSALFAELDAALAGEAPIPTVDLAWILTAATVARGFARSSVVAERAAARLLEAQTEQGLFPHALPLASQSHWRRHVGSFADQVYPIQALARWYACSGQSEALAAAERTAGRICAQQGPAGQWWWHYDVRTGEVVERYPVYSVHQHAMAPMVLFDLAEAGGADRTAEVVRGLRWLGSHPEVAEELVLDVPGVIWRKVGRREPKKAVRKLSSVTTAVRPGLHLPGLDRTFPPVVVDWECRPYELGWLLYAWLPSRETS